MTFGDADAEVERYPIDLTSSRFTLALTLTPNFHMNQSEEKATAGTFTFSENNLSSISSHSTRLLHFIITTKAFFDYDYLRIIIIIDIMKEGGYGGLW